MLKPISSHHLFHRIYYESANPVLLTLRVRATGECAQDFAIVDLNPAVERVFGYHASDLVGKTLGRWMELAGEVAFPFQEAVETGRNVSFESTCRTLQGKELSAHLSIYPVQKGREQALILVYGDETHVKRMQELLVQLDKRSAASEIAIHVCHEIRNPLTTVIGLTELLKERISDPELLQDLESIEEEAFRANKILDDLLLVAREAPEHVEPLQLNALVESIVGLRQKLLATRNISVEMQLDGRDPLVVADAGQLRQVLLNLLINAEQALQGRAEAQILVTTAQKGDCVVLAVQDNGPGIPSDILEKIFDPLFTTKRRGTGLGLFVSQRIARRLGGQLHVETPAGGGCRFVLELPRHPSAG